MVNKIWHCIQARMKPKLKPKAKKKKAKNVQTRMKNNLKPNVRDKKAKKKINQVKINLESSKLKPKGFTKKITNLKDVPRLDGLVTMSVTNYVQRTVSSSASGLVWSESRSRYRPPNSKNSQSRYENQQRKKDYLDRLRRSEKLRKIKVY